MARRVLAILGTLLFSLPVASAWLEPGIPIPIKTIAAGVFALALVRPAWALCVVAAALPLAPRIAPEVRAPFTSAELAELMLVPFLCAASLRLIGDRRRTGSRLAWAAVTMAAIVAAAAVVGLRAEQLARTFPPVFFALLRHHWLTSYFGDQSAFTALHIAMTWIEALALAVIAERLLRAHPRSASWIVGSFLAGGAAASWLAWVRVIEVWRRQGFDLASLRDLLLIQRISTLYADVNAAGSLFAMYVVAAAGLALLGGKAWRWLWVAAVVVLGALWVTGSRTAQASAVIAFAILWFFSWLLARRTSRAAAGVIGAVASVALVAGAVLWSPGRNAQSSSSESFAVRWGMARIAGQAVAGAPAFGIGLGEFRNFAREHTPAVLVELFPAAANGENAHNNFLQVLAELGVAGLLAFVWIIGESGGAVVGAVRAGAPAPALMALAGGVLAFCITCLAGHPLLIVEVLFLFFLAIGLAAGLGPVGAPGKRPWRARIGVAAVSVVVVSAPVRFWLVRQTSVLDGVVIGAGPPTDADYGVRYRVAGPHSVWFFSSRARAIEIPLRLGRDSRRPCLVRVEIDGRTVDTLEPAMDDWTVLTFQLDPARKAPVSRQVDIDRPGATCQLLVGQFTTRE